MVDHDLLHRELANFAAALTDDFDVHEALYTLVSTAAQALEIAGAGLTVSMPDGGTHYIAATDPVTMHVERRQDELQQGACVDAISTSEVVAASDLRNETRWPQFRPVLLEAGFQAAAGVPVRFRGHNIGAVNLYDANSRPWTTDEFDAGRLVADLAGGYLVNSYLLRSSQSLAAQLQGALASRIVIEQAKGILAGRHGMTPDAAFEVLRGHARSHRVKLHELARGIVDDDDEVLQALEGFEPSS